MRLDLVVGESQNQNVSKQRLAKKHHDYLFSFFFGNRICPGRWLALDTSWLVISCILATCTVKKALDSEGKEIEPVIEYEDGLVE
jgi:hypothetical protein